MRAVAIPALLILALAGCSSLRERPPPRPTEPSQAQPPRPPTPGTPRPPPGHEPGGRYALDHDVAPKPDEVPPDLDRIPDAVPRAEPRSRSGNSPQYSVFGVTYRVLDNAAGYRERGGASWYGKKFHGHTTASGDRYDMFAMTAAHKTLPLPSYVRVTHLGNGRSVVVKVNDRGPFHKGRIIDLSYAAAARLDMLASGSAQVEVTALVPGEQPLQRPPHEDSTDAPGFLQVASFVDPINAVNLREELSQRNLGPTAIWVESDDEVTWHRVVLGPFADTRVAHAAVTALQQRGLKPLWVKP